MATIVASEALKFSQWLKERRKALDFTQEDLAERVGCSIWTIRKIEMGERKPSRQVVELLADALQVPDDERPIFVTLARGGFVATSTPADAPPTPTNPTNLPASPTPLIGREAEVGKARSRLLEGGTRLLTLTGPPGIGKTRLALDVAGQLLAEFGDGVFFVPLVPVSAPSSVASAIAQVIGLKTFDDEPIEAKLIQRLQHKQMLLLLDNFEHVMSAANLLADLLLRCPALKVLVTSREALRLRGEHRLDVPPLALPPEAGAMPVETLAHYTAVQLFVERAQAVSNFRLTEENAATVAAICARLDGLPLAIELVAARCRLLPPKALLSRLIGSERRTSIQLAAGGARDLAARHQTLRNAIEWSYDLLEEGEQKLFTRMAVFVGGSSIAAAEAVCNALGDLPLDLLDGVESLLDKSLLRQEGQIEEGAGDEEPRFAMLETIRAFARERLQESGEGARVQRWHADYYLALAEAAESELSGSQQGEWLSRLEREHDNIRAVFEWSLNQKPERKGGEVGGDEVAEIAEIALRLSGALWRFWETRGHLIEGRRWLMLALENARYASIQPVVLAKTLNAAGNLAYDLDDYKQARTLHEESLVLSRELGDKRGIARSLASLANIARSEGDYRRAKTLMEESLALAREGGDKLRIAFTLRMLGVVYAAQGEYPHAKVLAEESLAIVRSTGNKLDIARSLNVLGEVARCLEDYTLAYSVSEEILSLRRALEDKVGIAQTLCNLGYIVHYQGDIDRAATLFAESLLLRRELGDNIGIAVCLEGLAAVISAQGQPQRAAQLFGASYALQEHIGAQTELADRIAHDRNIATLRSQLNEASYNTAWEEGQSMSLEQAIEYALSYRPPGPTNSNE